MVSGADRANVEDRPARVRKPGRALQEGRRAADADAPGSEGRERGRADEGRDRVLVTGLFADGERVDVIGTSRGKGFQGVIKRHHFAGGAATHGSMFHRAPGSIGASSFPSRVIKGMRAPGRMGGDRVTVRNLKIVRVDSENNLLVLHGAIPGAPGSITGSSGALTAKKIAAPQPEKPSKQVAKATTKGVRSNPSSSASGLQLQQEEAERSWKLVEGSW